MNDIKSTNHKSVSENMMVSPNMAFFLVHSMMVGVGILGFERYIVKDAGYDAWISILIAGVWIHILLWISMTLLKDGKGDIITIHQTLFGKWIGGFFSLIFSIYIGMLSLTVLRTFTELLQVWVFPQLNVWMFSGFFLLLSYYFIIGGFRTVTGICVISVLLGLPLLLLNYFPIKYLHVQNVYPIITHSFVDIIKSAKTMILSYLGIELILIYYPFIKKPKESVKWAHFGVTLAMLIYLGAGLISFTYFNEKQILQVVWASITLWKIVEFPFIERFEYIGISMWVYVILPNICLSLWAASRAAKRIFNVKQKFVVWIYMVVIFFMCGLLKDRASVDLLNNYTGKIGFYIISVYIPILFIWQKIYLKVRS